MKYVNESEYEKYSNFIKEPSELDELLELASIDINRATKTRIEKIGFDNLTTNQKELVKKAVCKQADYIKENEIYDDVDDSLSSYSIGGDLTVNMKDDISVSSRLKISKKAYTYLKLTGLCNRIA